MLHLLTEHKLTSTGTVCKNKTEMSNAMLQFQNRDYIVQSLDLKKISIGLVYGKEKQTGTADVNTAP